MLVLGVLIEDVRGRGVVCRRAVPQLTSVNEPLTHYTPTKWAMPSKVLLSVEDPGFHLIYRFWGLHESKRHLTRGVAVLRGLTHVTNAQTSADTQTDAYINSNASHDMRMICMRRALLTSL